MNNRACTSTCIFHWTMSTARARVRKPHTQNKHIVFNPIDKLANGNSPPLKLPQDTKLKSEYFLPNQWSWPQYNAIAIGKPLLNCIKLHVQDFVSLQKPFWRDQPLHTIHPNPFLLPFDRLTTKSLQICFVVTVCIPSRPELRCYFEYRFPSSAPFLSFVGRCLP